MAYNQFNYGSNATGVIQKISTDGTCDGSAPSEATAVWTAGRKTYAAAAAGGLFNFSNENTSNKSITVIGYEFVLGGQSAWTLTITDGVSALTSTTNDVLWASGTTAATAISSGIAGVVLLPGQCLRLTTTGNASGPWYLTIKVAYTISEGGIWI
jgi:hypothetical protein